MMASEEAGSFLGSGVDCFRSASQDEADEGTALATTFVGNQPASDGRRNVETRYVHQPLFLLLPRRISISARRRAPAAPMFGHQHI